MSGAAGLAALNRRLEKVPDEAVRDLVRWFVPRSEQIGGRGRWFGRNVKLSSKIKKRSKRDTANTVVLQGTPAALWSIKSYGRRGNYTVRVRRADALHLPSGAVFDVVHIKTPTKGDRRWDRLVDEANDRFVDVVARVVDKRVIR
jgi:hypothetical protein